VEPLTLEAAVLRLNLRVVQLEHGSNLEQKSKGDARVARHKLRLVRPEDRLGDKIQRGLPVGV